MLFKAAILPLGSRYLVLEHSDNHTHSLSNLGFNFPRPLFPLFGGCSKNPKRCSSKAIAV